MKIKEIFDFVSNKEKHEFVVNEQYCQQTPIQIETRDGYKSILSMIVKEDIYVDLIVGELVVTVSYSHKIITPNGAKFVNELVIGDKLSNVNGDLEITNIIVGEKGLVYDLTVDSEDHLYVDANGFEHHNTFHITEGDRSLSKLLGPVNDKWTYHSGTKAAPFSLYKTLFQERKQVIVFDEADSLLKNKDIIMMLKPINTNVSVRKVA